MDLLRSLLKYIQQKHFLIISALMKMSNTFPKVKITFTNYILNE